MKKFFLTLLCYSYAVIGLALPPTWEIIPAESSLTFVATQNGSPVAGEFKHFAGQIKFDPNALQESSVEIIVDITSLSASYKDMVTTLKSVEWFAAKQFPTATFKAKSFAKTGDKTYEAHGDLTIRDKTLPIVLNFTLDNYTPTKAHALGSTVIKRTAFGIGQGEWSKTDAVKDDVKVEFNISAKK